MDVFAQACLSAANDEAQFLHFKKNSFFNLLWENRTLEEGEAYLRTISEKYPLLKEKFEAFRRLDQLGGPRIYDYGQAGFFSPSTLRFVMIAGDVESKIGGLSEKSVVQIGAGYGGLCKVMNDVSKAKSYMLVDLPEQLALAKKCLDQLGLDNVSYLTPEELPKNAHYDLVISDMSFSEFSASYQVLFFERVLSCSSSGYVLGHVFPKHYGVVPLNWEELKVRFKGQFTKWESQEPTLDRENYFIYWKN
jgi:hypothetical protein